MDVEYATEAPLRDLTAGCVVECAGSSYWLVGVDAAETQYPNYHIINVQTGEHEPRGDFTGLSRDGCIQMLLRIGNDQVRITRAKLIVFNGDTETSDDP